MVQGWQKGMPWERLLGSGVRVRRSGGTGSWAADKRSRGWEKRAGSPAQSPMNRGLQDINIELDKGHWSDTHVACWPGLLSGWHSLLQLLSHSWQMCCVDWQAAGGPQTPKPRLHAWTRSVCPHQCHNHFMATISSLNQIFTQKANLISQAYSVMAKILITIIFLNEGKRCIVT